jgi:hypothetical protein
MPAMCDGVHRHTSHGILFDQRARWLSRACSSARIETSSQEVKQLYPNLSRDLVKAVIIGDSSIMEVFCYPSLMR